MILLNQIIGEFLGGSNLIKNWPANNICIFAVSQDSCRSSIGPTVWRDGKNETQSAFFEEILLRTCHSQRMDQAAGHFLLPRFARFPERRSGQAHGLA